jgi:hypothetical protein
MCRLLNTCAGEILFEDFCWRNSVGRILLKKFCWRILLKKFCSGILLKN